MDFVTLIADLASERDRISMAIGALERLGRSYNQPSTTTTKAAPVEKKVRGAGRKKRKKRSADSRKAQAERMKAYWAAKQARMAETTS